MTPPASPPAPLTVEQLQADIDRWKALSRQNETNYNQTRTELQKLQETQQAAVEAAKTEGRTSALGEVSKHLVTAELKLQAVSAGTELPNLKFLDLDQFKGDDAKPNAEAIKSFIESLPKGKTDTEFPKLNGAGHNRGSDGKFTSLNPSDLADFISGGSFL
ncbi:hypothetical protein [Streptomyces sp. PsTaAH-124]|uniref:hypothetical protein n=1 Tax=Streptomyces sp. PsTaAH-124 TaxID=1157638 RepID=UPI0003614C8E|nr:hypothetical protein [Streptomyces sp. PsTaAH-124]